MAIYKCLKCGRYYSDKRFNRCPDCGSKERVIEPLVNKKTNSNTEEHKESFWDKNALIVAYAATLIPVLFFYLASCYSKFIWVFFSYIFCIIAFFAHEFAEEKKISKTQNVFRIAVSTIFVIITFLSFLRILNYANSFDLFTIFAILSCIFLTSLICTISLIPFMSESWLDKGTGALAIILFLGIFCTMGVMTQETSGVLQIILMIIFFAPIAFFINWFFKQL